MKFIVDRDADVAITTGDFILFAITHGWYFNVYVTHCAFAHHVAGCVSSRTNVYCSPYGTLPYLHHDGEIHIKGSISTLCRGDDLNKTIFQLQATGGCRWLSVSSQYQSVISDYIHQLMDY